MPYRIPADRLSSEDRITGGRLADLPDSYRCTGRNPVGKRQARWDGGRNPVGQPASSRGPTPIDRACSPGRAVAVAGRAPATCDAPSCRHCRKVLPAAHLWWGEYRLFLTPFVVGGGNQSLPNNVRLKLELLDERRFRSGVVYLCYRTRT